MTPLDILKLELDQWATQAQIAQVWLRDDDAVRPSPALDRLLDMAANASAPLALAVIPANATPDLAQRLAGQKTVSVLVHGYNHDNHAGPEHRKMELVTTKGRTVEGVIAELNSGRVRLVEMFGPALCSVLVPPWNRMADDVAANLHDAGFAAVSGLGWTRFVSHLPRVNVHVDIMDWKTRCGLGVDETARRLAFALSQARANAHAPIGIMTHHLVHDGIAWDALSQCLNALAAHPAARFCTIESLLASAKSA